jgi:hypothetical protein
MNNSTIFTLAHQLAKVIRNEFDSYKSAFAVALKQVNSHKKFYTAMSDTLTPVEIVDDAHSSANHHGYFCCDVQYSIRYKSLETATNYDGYWVNIND